MKTLLFILLIGCCGCYSSREIRLTDYAQNRKFEVVSVTRYDSSVIILNSSSNIYMNDTALFGYTEMMQKVDIPLAEIESLQIREFDLLKTALWVTAAGAVVVYFIAQAFKPKPQQPVIDNIW